MSGPVFAFVVAVVLAAFAGGYVWGWLNGSDRAEHAPQKCREMLDAAKRAADIWQGRARKLEAEVKQLRRDQAEHADAETATISWLIKQIDKANAAGTAPEPLALQAPARAGSAA